MRDLRSVNAQPGITSLVIVQPTPFCNIECSYCYLPERANRTTLTHDQIRTIFDKLMAFPTVSGNVTVVWHAGEPLVLKPDYYEQAFSIIRGCSPPSLQIVHAFQTNGMLIDDIWCQFFKKWNVSIGVSIDGPRHIHDASRKSRSGKGTFDRTIAGIEHLRREEIPFHVITVLTRMGLADPDALFALYKQIGVHDVGFNIEEEEGQHRHSSLRSCERDDAVFAFFLRFTQLMSEHNYRIAVRELDETIASIRYFDRKGPINNLVLPFGILTIDVRGNVFTFSPELAGYSAEGFPTFAIGNMFDNSFDEMRRSEVMQSMAARIAEGVDLCRRTCGYFSVCGGGAPSNKIFENGSFASGETLHCRLTKKQVTDFVLHAIESCDENRGGNELQDWLA